MHLVPWKEKKAVLSFFAYILYLFSIYYCGLLKVTLLQFNAHFEKSKKTELQWLQKSYPIVEGQRIHEIIFTTSF